MVQYEYVGRLGRHLLVCISVTEAMVQPAWDVRTELLVIPLDESGVGRIQLACASYASPLEAVEEAVALSRELERRAAEDGKAHARAPANAKSGRDDSAHGSTES